MSFLTHIRFRSISLATALLVAFLLANLPTASRADEPIDFNLQIRPLLSNSCVQCHGPDEEERASGLRFDTEEGSRADLGGYAAVVPGDPDASAIMERLTSEDEDERMPPVGKGRPLSKEDVELIRRWIKQGGNYAKHWAYEKPVRRPLPTVEDPTWSKHPIDAFVLTKLNSLNVKPSPRADRLTLARRVALDLTGLPPTWEEAQAFVGDSSDNAYAKYVDQMLSKPAFGERWARVWLDLARYADSAGYADDPARTIWSYRDYVVRSLNDNKPFDQFTIEQIAGDLLEDPTDEQLIATAFHRNTQTNNEGGTNDEEFRNVAVVDRVNTTMAVWMGTTMACAQCHTHKFDPITHEEYFKFFAFFNSTEDHDRRDESPLLEIWSPEQEQKREKLKARIAAAQQKLNQTTPEIEKEQAQWLGRLSQSPSWTPLVPADAVANKRELEIDSDGWIDAKGEKADDDLYTIKYKIENSKQGKRFAGFKIETSEVQEQNFVLSQVSATFTPADADRAAAKFVRVEIPGKKKLLHLAEVQAFSGETNLALKGKAKQSSSGHGGKAEFANDGNTSGEFAGGSVTHTNAENNPWLEIELETPEPIDKVVIWNRTDGGINIVGRLTGYKVSLLDENRKTIWTRTPDEVPQVNKEFAVASVVPLKFAHASADYQQSGGFTAASVLLAKPNPAQGWAIGGKLKQAHQLTLVPENPLELEPRLASGTITFKLDHRSKHKRLLLDRFRILSTSNQEISQWAKVPAAIVPIIKLQQSRWTADQQEKVQAFYRTIAPSLDATRAEQERLAKQLKGLKPTTTVPILRQLPEGKGRKSHIQIRGNYLSKGIEVTEGTPVAFHPISNPDAPTRMDLAKWLMDDENPLTARVIANRHWEQIFGIGIVETSEEFGSQGEMPSHPELLDWLAVELRESGWDLKAFLRLLVTSETYQQRSVTTSEEFEFDPNNRWLARGPRFRVSAEMVRDQALFVSGLLSDKMYGPPVRPVQPSLGLKAAFGGGTDWKTSEGEDRHRRGLYTTWRRSSPYPSMAQFDAPNREVCTVRRIRTNTPLQALVTLNDPAYVEAAQSLARAATTAASGTNERIVYLFQRCLTREPTEEETKRLSELVENAKVVFADDVEAAKKMATDPIGPVPANANAQELAAWTVVCNVVLNLDELLMKR